MAVVGKTPEGTLFDRVAAMLRAPRLQAWRKWVPEPVMLELGLPIGIAAAVVVGLVTVSAMTPIAGRGDYGQWLMTSRFYLGESIPEYRDVTALPPFVPMLFAAIRALVTDPVVALQVLNALLLIGLGTSFYLLGATLLSNRWAGVFSLLFGFLVTDRFLELFAFGGVLQASSLIFMALCLVAFARAASAPRIERRWWLLGTASLGLAVLSHVATGLIALPVGLGAAAIAVLPRRHLGWRVIARDLAPLLAGLLAVALYWALVLLPASAEYVANPASLAYRGPERLFSSLFSYWPTGAVLALGICAIGLGSLGELLRRRPGGNVLLLLWLAANWGALGYSMMSGAATDYPRFSTVLLAPLVVGAAAGMVWLVMALTGYVRELAPRVPAIAVAVAAVLLVVGVSAPFAVQRYARQSAVYQPRDAQALTAAVLWIDDVLGNEGGAVLTDVRDGKWLEGLTGREALFSLPVRYAFRPIEWQRSVDADALLRSTATLTSGLVTAMFIDSQPADSDDVPSDLLVRTNHGGEFVDVLRLSPGSVAIEVGDRQTTLAQFAPVRSTNASDPQQVSVTGVWASRSGPPITFLQRTTTWESGAALRILQESSKGSIATVLYPPAGQIWTVSDVTDREARVCLPLAGKQEPCVRVWVGPDNVSLRATPDGGLRLEGGRGGRIELLVTALTAGEPSVGLALLYPAALIAERNVRAALLSTVEPSYDERAARLQALGFHSALRSGPYEVLLFEPAAAPVSPR
jgi:hypothetical protein